MAIRHWSGRRLVGTWVAGAVGEVVLIALPVAFFLVLMSVGNTDVFAGGHRVGRGEISALRAERAVLGAEVDQRMAALKAIEANESRVELTAPISAGAQQAVRPLERPSAPSELHPVSADAIPWYGIPMAASLALYFFAIPVGLVAITLIWLITRDDRSSPPAASA